MLRFYELYVTSVVRLMLVGAFFLSLSMIVRSENESVPDEHLLQELRTAEMPLQKIGDVTVSGLFTEGMVLQRDMPVPIWGWGPNGTEVEAAFAGQTVKTKVEGNRWSVTLNPLRASADAQELRIRSGSKEYIMRDILVGDVWLCAGQSNMQVEMKLDVKAYPKRGEDIQKTYNPLIRFFKIDRASSRLPRRDIPPIRDNLYSPWNNSYLNNIWRPCDPKWIPHITATGFYFANAIQPEIKIPVGIIHAAKGATSSYHWVPAQAIIDTSCWSPYERKLIEEATNNWPGYVMPVIERWRAFISLKERQAPEWRGEPEPAVLKWPSCYFNGMIYPLAPFALKGVLWYQGEGDAGAPVANAVSTPYTGKMVSLITEWRELWNNPDMPFIITQLAGYEATTQDWPALREAQSRVPAAIGNTYMATAIDAGMRKNIHPYKKEIVGERLALVARKEVYGENLVAYGPTFVSATSKDGEVLVNFSNVGGGLVASAITLDDMQLSADVLEGFELAGEDGVFVKAEAKIVGAQVSLRSGSVSKPAAVRYAWANFPRANLYNKDGLPTFPFHHAMNKGDP